MKLLLDQKLSFRLCQLLNVDFPSSAHVRDHNLERASDSEIWSFARENDFVIVSKDSDMHDRSFLYGHPPKVIWIQLGNCTTSEIANLMQRCVGLVKSFLDNSESAFFILR